MPSPRVAYTVVWNEEHQKYLPQTAAHLPADKRVTIHEARRVAAAKNAVLEKTK